jgi:hypothetical protein
MKIVGFTALHYGKCYLNHAIRSIIDEIDSYDVLYSPVGSHGHQSDLPCPDSREALYEIASNAAGDKLRWFDGLWAHEGQQRDSIFQIVPDADVIVVLDSDEVWLPGLLNDAIEHGRRENVRNVLIPLRHYWRSFYKAFTHDPAAPVRLIFPKVKEGTTTFTTSDESYRLQHFGYAIRSDLMRYKLTTHGHKAELKPNWFDEVFMTNRQTDCHPVGSDYWLVTEDVTPPEFMLDHPYAHLDLIE